MTTSCNAPTGILLASAARIATTNSEEMLNNAQYRGILLHFSVTSVTATPSVVPTVQYYDYGAAQWVTWKALAARATAVETNALIYPSAWAAHLAMTDEVEAPMPLVWRLSMVHADADSITYSVGYQYLP